MNKQITLRVSDDLLLPLDAATQTFAFIARKGAGKTYAAGKLCERQHPFFSIEMLAMRILRIMLLVILELLIAMST